MTQKNETALPPAQAKSMALSIKPLAAWLIMTGVKIDEYRSWPTKFRGRFYVHSSHMTRLEFDRIVANEIGDPEIKDALRAKAVPCFEAMRQGGIIGSVELEDCESIGNGGYAFALIDAEPMDFRPCKGRLGFWPCDVTI